MKARVLYTSIKIERVSSDKFIVYLQDGDSVLHTVESPEIFVGDSLTVDKLYGLLDVNLENTQ